MSDSRYAILARDAYRDPAPGVTRIAFGGVSADITGNVLAIRGTASYANLVRDMEVNSATCREHPALGLCAAGALDAAEGLFPLVPDGVDTITGHSLGGQVAIVLAGLLVASGRTVRLLVTWSAPKAGGMGLVATLDPVEVRQYRPRGDVVPDWPFALDLHVRPPLIDICDWSINPLTAHSIDRACGWMAAREVVAVN